MGDDTIGGMIPLLDSRTMNDGQEFIGFLEGIEKIVSKKGEFKCFYFNSGVVTALVPFFSISSKAKYKPEDLLNKKVKLIVNQHKFFLTPLN